MKLSVSSLIKRNKKSGQLMHALKKTKVIEASLTNLHISQNAMLWRLGKNIDSSYLQMVVLSHITFFFFPFLFNTVKFR